MSVFHRVDDVNTLDAPTFFRFVWRLPAYQGVMANHVMRQATEQDTPAPPASGGTSYTAPASGRDVNPGTKATLQADPVWQGLISFG